MSVCVNFRTAKQFEPTVISTKWLQFLIWI